MLELVLAHGPLRPWLRRALVTVPEKSMSRNIYAATCRIIGVVHLLIQVCAHA